MSDIREFEQDKRAREHYKLAEEKRHMDGQTLRLNGLQLSAMWANVLMSFAIAIIMFFGLQVQYEIRDIASDSYKLHSNTKPSVVIFKQEDPKITVAVQEII